MAKRKTARFDENALVLALAKGEMSHAQIAKSLGLSEGFVTRVAVGQARPKLKKRIDAAARGFLEEAHRLSCRSARHAVAALLKLAGGDPEKVGDETRRKAAVDLLKLAFGEAQAAAESVGDVGPGTEKKLCDVSKANGGPEE